MAVEFSPQLPVPAPIDRPIVSYDADMPLHEQHVCDHVFDLIHQDPELFITTVNASYKDATDVIEAAEQIGPPQRNERYATKISRNLGRVLVSGYDAKIGYDDATERAAKIQHKKTDSKERVRLNRFKLYAARVTIHRAQQAANEPAQSA